MNVEIKCELIAEETRANFESKNQIIMEDNKNSRASRIRNWIILIVFTIGMILFFNVYLLLPKIQLGRAMLAASLTMFVIMNDFLFLLALPNQFFEKKTYTDYGIRIKVEEIEFFNYLKNHKILDIKFLKYRKELDLEITYEDKDMKVSKKMMRGFRKVEEENFEKYILDLDNRTVTVPYEMEVD
jgi:hypothetical protein